VNDILKQRLVGALILLALGVVFWPIIFVGPDEQSAAELQPIPPPPGVSTASIDPPEQGRLRGSPELETQDDGTVLDAPLTADDAGEGEGRSESDPASTPSAPTVKAGEEPAQNTDDSSAGGEVRSEAPQRLAMDANGVPVAWALQVATVSSAEKAESLRKRLMELHHKAYISRVSSGGKSLYRISVGPKFERAELEKLQAGINAEFGVNSVVARYTP